MSGTTKKFLVENFANIAIALSVIFLIFELNQNRRMMERELVFMEAQAFQGRADIAMNINLETAGDSDLHRIIYTARTVGLEPLTEIQRSQLFDYLLARKIVVENTHYQVGLGLVAFEFWEKAGVNAVERNGSLWRALGIPMNPSFDLEVSRILANMNTGKVIDKSTS